MVLKNMTTWQQGKGMQPAAAGSTMGDALKSTLIYYEGQGTGGETGSFEITRVLWNGCSVLQMMFPEYEQGRERYIDGRKCFFREA